VLSLPAKVLGAWIGTVYYGPHRCKSRHTQRKAEAAQEPEAVTYRGTRQVLRRRRRRRKKRKRRRRLNY
jgi:hypothetical protein